MARVVLRHVCPSLHPLQTLLCVAFCAPEAVVSGLFSVARDQRMLISGVALPHMLFAISCLGHIQQRPGSDLPQLRAGELMWLTSPGLPVEVFEVTSHLVWTHQTTDDPRQMLGPRSPLSVRPYYTLLNRPRRMALRQAHHRFIVHALRHSAAARDQVDAAVTTFVGCFGRLRRVPWENGHRKVFWSLAVNCVRAAGACQRYLLALCQCGVVGSGAHGDCECLRQHAFWECSIGQAVCNWV
jgi:hypothetical protein